MVLTLVTHIGIFIEYSVHRIHYGILMALLIEKPSSPHPVDHHSFTAIEERCPLKKTILVMGGKWCCQKLLSNTGAYESVHGQYWQHMILIPKWQVQLRL